MWRAGGGSQRGGSGRAGQGPRGLASRAERDVLAWFWYHDVGAEERWGQELHGLRAGAAADEDDPLRRDAERPHGVGQRAEQALDGSSGDVGRLGGGRDAAEHARRGRAVGSALAVEVGEQRHAPGSRRRRADQRIELVERAAEDAGRRRQDP